MGRHSPDRIWHATTPPCEVVRLGSCHAPLWRIRCGECGESTRPFPLLSAALDDFNWHLEITGLRVREGAADQRRMEGQKPRPSRVAA